MNFLRKSTDGFSIGNILLDFSGGIANYGQMVVQSIDQGLFVMNSRLCVLIGLLAIWFYISTDIFKSHLPRFVGQLLWQYRKSVALSGMENSPNAIFCIILKFQLFLPFPFHLFYMMLWSCSNSFYFDIIILILDIYYSILVIRK